MGMMLAPALVSYTFASDQSAGLVMRGSDGNDVAISRPQSLEQTNSSYVIPVDAGNGATTYTHAAPEPEQAHFEQPYFPIAELGDGFRSTTDYMANSTVETLMFRGSHDAVQERDVVFQLPERAPLRRSMMHSVNYESGLRSGTVSVAQSVSAALRGSYSARERLERANIENARMHAAIGNFLPKVSASIDLSVSQRNSLTSGTYRQEIGSASIEATMPLFTSGVNTNTYRQARHVSIAADYTYLAEEQRSALEAVAAHVNLRLNRKIEASLKRNVSAMQRIRMIAGKLYEAGDASRTDVAIAQANVESARSELDIARRTREETLADYKSVTGHEAPHSLGLASPDSMMPATLDEAIQSALANNPGLLSAQHTAIASEHNAKVVRGQFGPQVEAYGRYDRYLHDSIQDNRQDDYSVGVRLRMPLLDFTAVPTIDAARHEASESGYRALEQARVLKRQIERQWSAYHSAARRVVIVQRQVNAVARSVEGARREYEAGFRAITDVLNDQVKLVRAQISLESARHEKLLAAYELAFGTSHSGIQHLALAN